MKIRLYKVHLVKTLNFYQQKLTEKFGTIARSESIKELIRREAEALQKKMAVLEKTNSWHMTIKVEFQENGEYKVVPENMNQILIMDE